MMEIYLYCIMWRTVTPGAPYKELLSQLSLHSKQKYTHNTHKTAHIQTYIGNIIAKKTLIKLLPMKLVSIR